MLFTQTSSKDSEKRARWSLAESRACPGLYLQLSRTEPLSEINHRCRQPLLKLLIRLRRCIRAENLLRFFAHDFAPPSFFSICCDNCSHPSRPPGKPSSPARDSSICKPFARLMDFTILYTLTHEEYARTMSPFFI